MDSTITFSAKYLKCSVCDDFLGLDFRSYGCVHAVCSACKEVEEMTQGVCVICGTQHDDLYYQDPWLMAVVATTNERMMRCGFTATGDVDAATQHTKTCAACGHIRLLEARVRGLSLQVAAQQTTFKTELELVTRRLKMRTRLQASLTEAAEREVKLLKLDLLKMQGVVEETEEDEDEHTPPPPSPHY